MAEVGCRRTPVSRFRPSSPSLSPVEPGFSLVGELLALVSNAVAIVSDSVSFIGNPIAFRSFGLPLGSQPLGFICIIALVGLGPLFVLIS